MGLGDLLKGKEKKISADPLAADINAAGKSGIGMIQDGANSLNSIYSQDPTSLINKQIGMENAVARNAADDATRRTRQLIAQRGMGGSSIGLGQEVNQKRSLMETLGLNSASREGRIRDMSIGNAQGRVNAGNSLWNLKASQGPIQMTDVKYRTGGLAGLIGAGVGGYLGGAQGAQAGMGIGQMYQNS
jgi:hypothetical protein